ncbi:hypothetical protein B0W48_09695 [Pseudoalteromonas aliena]|jgi:hypothetical protein|uniref:Uncharacterized protein n=2 Tax=Pseudoalteromonas aliena TaxID=247523 RepID=A0A1Q2GY75_9GAMM|nr:MULTISPECIES: hypothetical protein [Pseudoalteromonas]AQQ00037.1 hypothetical protein B0W48_09695 [Pseudoalteromonas aliena]MBE0358508.1 hypothetical protein [Pseudoalteromonas aliena SW19]
MKKIYSILLGASMFSGAAMADTVSCYVDTQAYDQYSENQCFGGGPLSNHRQGAVVFKVNASKPIQSVTWNISAFGAIPRANSCNGSTCIVDVGRGERNVEGCVDKIYYKDYTWADVNWCATANAYYWADGQSPLSGSEK